MSLPLLGEDRRLQIVPEGMPLEIDWSHPLTRGLCFFALPGHPDARNLVTGHRPTVIGTALSRVPSPGGISARVTDAMSGLYWPFPPQLATATTEATIVTWQIVETANQFASFISVPYRAAGWTSPWASMQIWAGTGGKISLSVTIAGSTVNYGSAAGMYTADGVLHQIGVVRQNGTVDFYRDGRFHSLASSGAGNFDWNERRPVVILTRSDTSPGEGQLGRCTIAAIWARALSAAEVLALYRDPLAFIRVR